MVTIQHEREYCLEVEIDNTDKMTERERKREIWKKIILEGDFY